MDALSNINWADYGIAGLFIAFLIWLVVMYQKREEKRDALHAAEKERLQKALDECQERLVNELRDNQKTLFDALQGIRQAIEIVRASRG